MAFHPRPGHYFITKLSLIRSLNQTKRIKIISLSLFLHGRLMQTKTVEFFSAGFTIITKVSNFYQNFINFN